MAKFRVTVGGIGVQTGRGVTVAIFVNSQAHSDCKPTWKATPFLLVGGKVWKESVLFSLPVSMFLDLGEFIH